MMAHLFRCLTFAIGVCLTLAGAALAEERPPNVVLIFADDLGVGDIGPFGNTKFKTPQLDRLATEGTKFTSFYATPVCSMSRACLMTGCYNSRISIPGVLFPPSKIGLNPEEVTLAEIFKQKGYATTCIGKWHLGHREPFLPTKQGFDSYFGIPYSNDMAIDPVNARFAKDCLFREGMTEEKAREKPLGNTVPLMRGLEVVEYPADQSTLTQRYTAEAVQFIRQQKDKPFFLYLPHAMVHVPLAASEKFRGKSGGGLFGDAVEELDWSVGEILAALKELQLENNTLVIFTSDNGAATGSSAPFRGKKASNFEGGVREPCIMRWPGKIAAGTACPQIAGNIDLLPTFAKLIGAELPKDRAIDGRDLSSLMFDAKAKPVRDTHLYFNAQGNLAAIRRGDWKLFLPSPLSAGMNLGAAAKKEEKKQPPARPQLYNLLTDPAESKDVAADEQKLVADLTKVAGELVAEIREHRRPAGKVE